MSALLRVCALAHPRTDRALVLALAEDLVQDGAPMRREAWSLLTSGLAVRLRLSGAPWRDALTQLALPVASLFVAAMILGGTRAPGWIGWSWAGGIAGAALAFAGIALGRRTLALPGALLVAGLCTVDGLRDQYGVGSRWIALFVDVLPALGPLALVLVAAAVYPSAQPARRVAWAAAAAAALVLVAVVLDSHTTAGTTVLVVAAALCLGFVLRGCFGDEIRRLAGALALAAATPAGAWSATAAVPVDAPDALAFALMLGLMGAGAVAALRLATQSR